MTSDAKVNFGAHLRELRQRQELTQDALATRLGMKVPQLSRMEQLEFPDVNVRTLLRLQAALGLDSIEELLGDLPRGQFPSAGLAAALDGS